MVGLPQREKAIMAGAIAMVIIFLIAISHGVTVLAALFRGVVAGILVAGFTAACLYGWQQMERQQEKKTQAVQKKQNGTAGQIVDVKAGAEDDLARDLAGMEANTFQPVNLAALYANSTKEKDAARAAAAIREIMAEKGPDNVGRRKESNAGKGEEK